jgi:hypothetical protein
MFHHSIVTEIVQMDTAGVSNGMPIKTQMILVLCWQSMDIIFAQSQIASGK